MMVLGTLKVHRYINYSDRLMHSLVTDLLTVGSQIYEQQRGKHLYHYLQSNV